MKTKLFLLFFAAISTFSFRTTIFVENEKKVTLSEFTHLVDSVGLTFTMPPGHTVTSIKENKDLYYCFAFKNDTADFEIRYSIWSLKADVETYKKNKADTASKTIMVNPNLYYSGRAQSNVLNMTSGESMRVTDFPKAAVKKEFNADIGGSSFFEFKCEFGKGYKYGQMIVLHKDDVADVIITYLSNNRETHSDLMMIPFHSLVFK